MAEAARTQCTASARLLQTLVQSLPKSVPLAYKDGKICEIFEKVQEPLPTADPEEHWVTPNCCMDLLFGNDVRDKNGNLYNITRGPFGMDLVVNYALNAVKAGHLLWEAALPKFSCLITAVNDLK